MADEPTTEPAPPIVAAAEVAIKEHEALKAKLAAAQAELAARPAAPAAPAPTPAPVAPAFAPEDVAAFKGFVQQQRETRVLDHLRKIGLEALQPDVPPERRTLTTSEILAIVPQADPSTPEGVAAFDAYKKAHAAKFRAPGQTQESIVEATRQQLPEKKSVLFDSDKLLASVFRGGG